MVESANKTNIDKQYVKVAVFTSPHGLKGQMKLLNFMENPRDIVKYMPLKDSSGKFEFDFKISPAAKGKWIATIKDISTREQAEELKGMELFIPRARLETHDDESFFIHDLCGMKVIDESGEDYGTVISLNNYGAGDVIEIDVKDGDKPEIYPFTKEIFPDININEDSITILPPEVI